MAPAALPSLLRGHFQPAVSARYIPLPPPPGGGISFDPPTPITNYQGIGQGIQTGRLIFPEPDNGRDGAISSRGANKEGRDDRGFELGMEMGSLNGCFRDPFFSLSSLLSSRNYGIGNYLIERRAYRLWGLLYKLYKFGGAVFENAGKVWMGQFVWQGLSSMKFRSWENVAFSTVV